MSTCATRDQQDSQHVDLSREVCQWRFPMPETGERTTEYSPRAGLFGHTSQDPRSFRLAQGRFGEAACVGSGLAFGKMETRLHGALIFRTEWRLPPSNFCRSRRTIKIIQADNQFPLDASNQTRQAVRAYTPYKLTSIV